MQSEREDLTAGVWVYVCVRVLQVSQYTFAMCSYREKKAEPQELMQMEGYTVDYCDPQPGACMLIHTHEHTCKRKAS